MSLRPITLAEWEERQPRLEAAGLAQPDYGGPLGRHVRDGDLRLRRLTFDPAPEALRLWNFLLSEEERLFAAKERGWTIVGAMKDLGTVPILAYSLPRCLAFYPDGAWWIPCVMELSAGLLAEADALGVDDSFCPVRAMLGAFAKQAHFPRPDLVACSVGATCDDLSAIAQRVQGLGIPIHWWEIPFRRHPDPGEEFRVLPGGFRAPASLVGLVREELSGIARRLEALAGERLTEARLAAGIRAANEIRALLGALRRRVFTAPASPLPALELLIAEMLALHFCSDREECHAVLQDLLALVERRVAAGEGFPPEDAVRVFWVNPVADLRVMNLLEECGGRLCGTELLFCHALDPIPTDLPPLEALARMALADPMVGPARDRAERIVREARALEAEALVISRIPGASHCGREGLVLAERIREETSMPVLEIEVPPLTDAMAPSLQGRLQALVEAVRESRR